jgi:hypothetical protein
MSRRILTLITNERLRELAKGHTFFTARPDALVPCTALSQTWKSFLL